MTQCTICNTVLDGEFCKNCGQQNTQKKLDLKSFFSDLSSNLLDLDKTVFFNIYYVLRYPKKVVENYWAGFRNYYYNPGKVLFYFVTLAGLSSFILENTLFGLAIDFSENVSTQFAFVVLIYPILILTSYITYFRRKKTIIEHATAGIYIISALGIVILIAQIIFTFFDATNNSDPIWFLLLIMSVIVWSALVFTHKQTFLTKVLNSILGLIVFLSIIGLLLVLININGGLNLKLS